METTSQAEDDGKDKEKPDSSPYTAHGADNQKLNLLAAMLKVDDWASAEVLLEALEPVLPVAYAPVAQAFCQHIHRFIDSVYRQVQVCSAGASLPTAEGALLGCLGSCVGKVCTLD
jgi:hypothetical protein